MGRFTKLLNFEEQLTFYSAYHHHPVNKLIHMIFVPTIMWTVLVWLTPLSPSTTIPFVPQEWTAMLPPLGPAWFVTTLYSLYYILLEPLAGLLYSPILFGLAWCAHWFRSRVVLDLWQGEASDADWYALYMHIMSWIMQFAGHFLAEGRAPALFDSLLQAFLLAPMFVWMEFLFLFGYRPKLQARLESKTVQAIAEWKQQQESSRKKDDKGKAGPAARRKRD